MSTDNNMLDPRIIEKMWEAPRLSDRIYWAIRDSIASGRIKPGEWLREEALTQELGASRITVREALQRLVSSGLAVHEPYRGVRLLDSSLEEIEEVYQIRLMLEGWAMELAAGRIRQEELKTMEELLPFTVAGDDPAMITNTREANREFHWIAIRASNSKKLISLLEQLWEILYTHALHAQSPIDDRIQSSKEDMEQHKQILDALKAGNGKEARRAAEHHIQDTLETIQERMSAVNNTETDSIDRRNTTP